jgi:hypothetical protein
MVKMDIGDDGNADLFLDLRQGFGILGIQHGEAHQIQAHPGQLIGQADLISDIAGLMVRHGLQQKAVRAADGFRPDGECNLFHNPNLARSSIAKKFRKKAK